MLYVKSGLELERITLYLGEGSCMLESKQVSQCKLKLKVLSFTHCYVITKNIFYVSLLKPLGLIWFGLKISLLKVRAF